MTHNLRIPNYQKIPTKNKNFFPYQGTMTTILILEEAKISGPAPVHVSNLEIAFFTLTINKLLKNNKALFGVSSRINLKESLKLGKVELPSRAYIKALKQSLNIDLNLAPQKLAEIFNVKCKWLKIS